MSAHSTHTFGRPYTWAAQPGTGTLFAQRSVFCPSPMHTKPAESVLFFWSSVCVYYPICSFNICIMCGCEFVRQMLLFLLAYVFRTLCGCENVCTYECAISLDYGFTNENKTATATTTFDEDILTCSVYFVPIETETIWMHESIWEGETTFTLFPCVSQHIRIHFKWDTSGKKYRIRIKRISSVPLPCNIYIVYTICLCTLSKCEFCGFTRDRRRTAEQGRPTISDRKKDAISKFEGRKRLERFQIKMK